MYDQFLTKKAIFFNWQTGLLLAVFGFVRLLSFVLVDQVVIQAFLIFVILLLFGLLYYRHTDWAWMILLAEIFLGGAGHFLSFFGLSIRTVLLLTFLGLWVVQAAVNRDNHHFHIPHKLFYLLVTLALFIALAAINGVVSGNSVNAVIQDLVPYTFFLLLLPAYHLFQKSEQQEFLIRLVVTFLIGSALFSLLTFILFSTGTEVIHGEYYKWFRDVAAGKITDMGGGFFRIVTPEHLLIPPIVLFVSSLLMRDEKHHKLWYTLLFFSILILVLNLSRTYLLAIFIGFFFLKYKHSWSKWLRLSVGAGVTTIASFVIIHAIASGGALGFDLLGVRFGSISRPITEVSTYTRAALLPPIIESIRERPLLGNGLGSTITFWNPVSRQTVTTSQYDWGYLELLSELGILGFLSFIILIAYTVTLLIKKISQVTDYHDFYVGLLAGFIAFLVMNITAPALFHVFGIFFTMFVMVIAMKPPTLMNYLVILLYRVFHRLKV